MGEFLAEAVINVRADTKKFLADFNKAVKQAEKTKITVTVTASMTGFRNDLITKLNTSKRGVTVDVPVRPDMTGFRTALAAAVKSSSKGIIAEVGVRAGAVTKGAAASATGSGAAAVASKSLTAEAAAARAVEAGLFARRQITGLIDEQDKRLARIVRQDAAILAAQEAQKRAILEQNGALQAQAVLVEQRARAEREITRGAFEKEAARRTARDPGVREAAAAESQATSRARDAARAQELVKDLRAADEASAKRIQSRQDEVRKLLKIEETATAAETKLRVTAAKSAQNQIEAIRTDITGIDEQSLLAGPKREGALRRQITTLTHAEKDAKKALDAATKAGLISEAAELKLLQQHSAALLVDAQAALVNSAAQTKRLSTLANVRRALVAQIANLTGLRGAALTAASAFIATSAAILSLRKAVNLAAEMESRLAVFQVTAGATAEQMDLVHEKAVELGRDITLPAVSAADAAVALQELSKAGLSVQDAMDGAKGVLQLATAANISFEQATLLAANALNSFGLAGEDATHVADVLANAANQSQGSIVDMGVALQQSSAVIRQAGLSLEEGVAALTLFARAGLRGSDAGTSLRTALIRLINPSKRAQETINELGLDIRDASGAIDLNVFQQFTDATRDLTTAQRDQALAIIFGQDAIRGAAILAREGSRGLEEQEKAIQKSGTAAEVASARTSGYAGALENLKNQIEATGEEIGASLLGPLTTTIGLMADAVEVGTKLGKTLLDLPSKPIEFAFDIAGIEDEGLAGVFKTVVSGTNIQRLQLMAEGFNEVRRATQDLREGLEDLTGLGFLSDTTTIKQAKAEIHELVEEISDASRVRLGGGLDGPIIGDTEAIHKAVLDMKELQEELQGGDKEAKAFAATIGELILQIQDASTEDRPITFVEAKPALTGKALIKQIQDDINHNRPPVIRVSPEIDEGATEEEVERFGRGMVIAAERESKKLEEVLGEGFHNVALAANREFTDGFLAGLLPNTTLAAQKAKDLFLQGFDPASIGDTAAFVFLDHFTTVLDIGIAKASKDAADGFAAAAARAAAEQAAATKQATTQGENQARGADRAQIEAQLDNDRRGEIAAIRRRIAARQREIDRINKATQGDPKDKALQDRTAAQKAIIADQNEIKSIEESIKSDADKKKTEIEKARNDADQAVLDSLFPATRKLETAALVAEGTARVQDDIKVAQQQIQNNKKRIATINKLFKDRKQAAKLIADIRDENITLAQQIAGDFLSIFQADQDALKSFAELTGDTPFLIKLLNQQIVEARQALALAKAAKAGVIAAKVALDTLIETRRQMVNDAKTNLLEQAFRLAELKGNKSAMLQILDLQIAQAQAEVAQAKTLAQRLKEMGDVWELINKRKELLGKEVGGERQGTTAFELLKASAETFTANAGNLIGANQPFAGPTGFTADMAQFLRRQKGGAAGGVGASKFFARDAEGNIFGQPRKQNRQEDLTTQLIAALQQLTNATLQASGNASTAGTGGYSPRAVDALGKRGAALARYWEQKNKRAKNESRSDSEGGSP